MTPEQWTQGIGIGFAIVLALAAAFWWGWEVRARLAEKVEYFGVTNRRWHQYDDELRSSRTKRVPLKAELHDIHERESRR